MNSEYRARNHRDLQIPKARLEYAKRKFYFSSIKHWNEIYDNIREQESIARFKKVTGPKHEPLVEKQIKSVY